MRGSCPTCQGWVFVRPRAVILVLALAGGLLAAACNSPRGSTSGGGGGNAGGPAKGEGNATEAELPAVRVAPLERGAIAALYTTSTTIRADKEATVTARTRGIIRRLAAEEGDAVSASQPLAYLEDEEQRIEFERAQTTRDTKQREYERVHRLHGQGLVSDEEHETSRRELEDATQAASLAELALSRTVIKSPFAGLVLRRHLDVGATVSDGTPVYAIADVNPLYADVNVPERQVGRLAPGQSVRLTADASGETVQARIERIAPSVDPATGTVKVTLSVTGGNRLRPGAFVRVGIVTDTHQDALIAPRSALVAEGRRWHVFRLWEEDKVQQVEVKIGFEEGDRVEIAEVVGEANALDRGMPVVIVGAPALADGDRVRVLEGEATEQKRPDAAS